MKKMEIEQMEQIEGGRSAYNVIGCAGTVWGAIEFGALLVGLAAGGPVTWVVAGSLILAPTLIGVGATQCLS